jgi:hypothetical protein
VVEGSAVIGTRVFVCLLLLGIPTVGSAQQSDPQDAREFLAQHALFESSSKTTRADEETTLTYARFYLHAGAENELRGEVTKLSEEHPVALRYAMLADCWNPATYAQGLARSEQWLENFPKRSDAEQQSVIGVRDYLADKESLRLALNERRAATAWLPFLSLAAVAAMVTGGMRRWP